MAKRKKSLVGWTYNLWQMDFKSGDCEEIQIPTMWTKQGRLEDWIEEAKPIKKVRITIKEIN